MKNNYFSNTRHFNTTNLFYYYLFLFFVSSVDAKTSSLILIKTKNPITAFSYKKSFSDTINYKNHFCNNKPNLTTEDNTTPIAPPSNDNCSGAITLTPSTTCSFTTYTNASATASGGVTTPSCSSYSGGDVWFKIVVPASGKLEIDTKDIVVTDGGMAIYTGTCGSLTEIACDDDSSTNGSMPRISLSNLVSGSTIYVRFWEYGNDNNGTFGICVTTCLSGSSTGTTTLGCPNVIAGGLGLSGSDPAPITCSTSGCVDLEATYLALGQTTSYTVQSIPYAPPYQFGCLKNSVSVNTDDVWSPIINLPFNFCFYGNNYNNCTIGSNGLLSFDTTLAGTPSGYEFSNNLPSTTGALFKNTIYGVYHDIDPSVGGEVGWELITLNTGCRALVASWNNVPMYSDNTILYTGMMVLYENTNIIEVYAKEKKIDNNNVLPWNDGNAIIGIQNATGTIATVAPGRNGLDTNWTATNEAWRFTPSGSSITTINWFEGATASGPVIGTGNTINVCPGTTKTYTAEVTYTLCGGGTIKLSDQTTVTVSGTKIWTGATSTNWNTASNWSPAGVPTNTTSVVIPNTTAINKPIVSGTMAACNITVQNGGLLTIASGNSITVDNFVNVNTGGTFIVKNDASLVQINNVANIVNGTFTYERSASTIKGSDYIYWSSPVANQDMSNIYTTPTQGPKYLWNTTATNSNGGMGNWASASGVMSPAKGYIIRGSNNYNLAACTINSSFTGTPNNGNITIKATRGSMLTTNVGPSLTYPNPVLNAWDDNWNFIGNPYPSAINGLQFLSTNTTNLMGSIRLWRHLNTPTTIASPFYQSFVYNYNSSDYLTINFTGPTSPGASDIIKSCQGFMVQRKEGVLDPTGVDITFNNAMRRDGSTLLSNSGFFRNGNNGKLDTIEKNRIWIDIVDDANNTSETTLLGYVDGATTGWDDNFDATIGITSAIGIYSFTENEKCIIQGRPNPFSINDRIPLGINIHSNGNYHIAIQALDGLFADNNQPIYLEDKKLNIIHNLKLNPYAFSSNAGTINDRFILRYTNTNMVTNENNDNDSILIYANKATLNVKSSKLKIKDILVFDLTGKRLIDLKKIQLNEITINELKPTTNLLLVKVTFEDGSLVTKKVIY